MSSSAEVQLSLVVVTECPAWHLRDALVAAAAQRSAGCELIVVDGAGDETVSWIVDDVLGTSGTGTVAVPGGGTLVRTVERVAIGLARGTGQQVARGRHILHLDGRVVLCDGAVPDLLGRLSTSDPEVLLLEATEVPWWGKPRESVWCLSPSRGVREAVPQGPVDVPAAIVRADVAADAVLRWSGDRFADRGWLLKVALTGYEVQFVDEPVLELRPRERGVERRGVGANPSELFSQTGEVLALILADEDRRPVIERALNDGVLMLQQELAGRSLRERRAFVRAARRELRPHAAGIGPTGRRARALLAGSMAALSLIDQVSRGRGWLRGLGAERQRVTRRARALGLLSWIAQRLPLRSDLVVFSSYGGRSVAGSPLALYRELERQAPAIRSVWVLRAGVPSPSGLRCVRPGTAAYIMAVSRARVLVNNYNFGDQVPHRRGRLNVQTQHGSPLKTVGVDQHRYPGTAGGRSLEAFVRKYQRWDVVLSPSHHASEVLQRSFPGRYEIWHTGFPRNDVLTTGGERLRAETRTRLGLEDDDLAVLFVPTFRDGPRGFDARIDLTWLAEGLGPHSAVLARAHHFDRRRGGVVSRDRDAIGRVLDVSEEPSIEALYAASDVLVTDYSSAMFDYSLLGRPIVLYVPDLDSYRARRGLYLDLCQVAPGPVVAEPEGLLRVLSDMGPDDSGTERIAAFRRRYATFEDGRSAERVVGELLLPALRRRSAATTNVDRRGAFASEGSDRCADEDRRHRRTSRSNHDIDRSE